MYILTTEPFEFDSARNAIDCVSEFEATAFDDYDYVIKGAAQIDGAVTYVVRVAHTDEPDLFQFLSVR